MPVLRGSTFYRIPDPIFLKLENPDKLHSRQLAEWC
jgi:hypothetical protein